MELAIFKLAGWQLLSQMDWMATLIILSLFITSVFCIGLIITKVLTFRRNQQEISYLSQQVKHCTDFTGIVNLSKVVTPYLGSKLLRKSVVFTQDLLERKAPKELAQENIDELEELIDQTITQILVEEESCLSVLNISAMVSPLVGLFGTIWGLVHAFIDIGRQQAADITTIAPGIAMALLTTLAGLVVAIPAMAFYHYFTERLRLLEYNLFGFTSAFLKVAKQSLL